MPKYLKNYKEVTVGGVDYNKSGSVAWKELKEKVSLGHVY